MRITAKSYFSGAGGMDLGMLQSGIQLVSSYELDEKACGTLRQNFNHPVEQRDITKLLVEGQPDADVYIGTFPCTRYSTAASMSGTRTGDDLFLHFLRNVVLRRPEMYIVENVPGMLKFQVVMEMLTKLPDYYVRVECPVNANMWLPQDRKRLILIGTKKPFHHLRYPEAHAKVTLKDIIDPTVEFGELPTYMKNRLSGKTCGIRTKLLDPAVDNTAPTCLAHYAKDKSTVMLNINGKVRPFSVREYARLQGFPDWFKFFGTDRDAYRQIGNAVAVPMARWVGEQVLSYFEHYCNKSFVAVS